VHERALLLQKKEPTVTKNGDKLAGVYGVSTTVETAVIEQGRVDTVDG